VWMSKFKSLQRVCHFEFTIRQARLIHRDGSVKVAYLLLNLNRSIEMVFMIRKSTFHAEATLNTLYSDSNIISVSWTVCVGRNVLPFVAWTQAYEEDAVDCNWNQSDQRDFHSYTCKG
jgi:hypothetical protein